MCSNMTFMYGSTVPNLSVSFCPSLYFNLLTVQAVGGGEKERRGMGKEKWKEKKNLKKLFAFAVISLSPWS